MDGLLERPSGKEFNASHRFFSLLLSLPLSLFPRPRRVLVSPSSTSSSFSPCSKLFSSISRPLVVYIVTHFHCSSVVLRLVDPVCFFRSVATHLAQHGAWPDPVLQSRPLWELQRFCEFSISSLGCVVVVLFYFILLTMLSRFGSCTSESSSLLLFIVPALPFVSLPIRDSSLPMDVANWVSFVQDAGGPVLLGDCSLG